MRHVDAVWIFIWGKTHHLVKIRCSTLSKTSPWCTTSSIRFRLSTILFTIVEPTRYQHIIHVQVLKKINPSKYCTLLKGLQRNLLSITCFSFIDNVVKLHEIFWGSPPEEDISFVVTEDNSYKGCLLSPFSLATLFVKLNAVCRCGWRLSPTCSEKFHAYFVSTQGLFQEYWYIGKIAR
jgi:hypothetical protein